MNFSNEKKNFQTTSVYDSCLSYPSNESWHQKHQRCILEREFLNCDRIISNNSRNVPEGWCKITWDGLSCWPATAPNTIISLPCPHYVFEFNYEANVTKQCVNGVWYRNEAGITWSNYSACTALSSSHLLSHLNEYYLITSVGYTVSLVALLVAFLIFKFNKRLRSPKNNLHMKLFLSFILRCVLFHIKRLNAFDDLQINNFNRLNGPDYPDSTLANSMSIRSLACKILTILWQYSLLANYNFILMEAVYLHSLISFNTFNDNSSITRYVVFGWGIPAIIVIPWSIAKYTFENNECWITIDNTYIFWMIKGPITLSIILSFTIFVNVIRILYSKIFSSEPSNQINRKYSKLVRSTLVLVPLFGVHFTVLFGFNYLLLAFHSDNTKVVLFFFDLIFTSFQGFFVALLYCFFSSEVIVELRKSWGRFRLRKENKNTNRHYLSKTCNSILNQSIKQLDNHTDKQVIRERLYSSDITFSNSYVNLKDGSQTDDDLNGEMNNQSNNQVANQVNNNQMNNQTNNNQANNNQTKCKKVMNQANNHLGKIQNSTSDDNKSELNEKADLKRSSSLKSTENADRISTIELNQINGDLIIKISNRKDS